MSGEYIQAHICPVCHDDHSWGPHRFSDDERAARDAEVREQVAREIRAHTYAHGPDQLINATMEASARIAEGRA